MDSTYLPSISTLKRMSFEPRSHPCSTKLQALVIPEKAQEKLPTQAPKKEQMHTRTVFNHNKLCIYYAIRKSFTDSSLIVLSIQSIVTNCKGIAMEIFSQTMNVKRNVNTFSDLTWRSMRKESCTLNELGEFLMARVLERAQDTAHWKMQRKRASLPPQYPCPNTYNKAVQNYKTTGITASRSTTACTTVKTQ